jgi:hypothetical protein
MQVRRQIQFLRRETPANNMPVNRVVAIHQPTFFPWLGYFNKIARADLFLVLDNVQFQKTGGTWSNRVKLLVNGQAAWVTMPVMRNYHGVRTYAEMRIDNGCAWREKLLKTIHANYNRTPFFEEVFPALEQLISNPTDRVTDYNLSAIVSLAKSFRIDTSKLILGSTLEVQGRGTDLLISIVKSVDGTAYLCGGGTAGYQQDERFAAEGIELIYQNFQHPVYSQTNVREFVPGLSIVDALMNCGFENTSRLLTGESVEGANG